MDEDCIPIDDTLLDVSGIQAETTCHNPRKRTREEAPLSPNRVSSHSVQGIRQRSSPPRVPTASTSSSKVSDLTLTCQDGTVFQMAEFMKLMMEQLKTTNKVLSKGEESESTKRLRMAEAEVIIFHGFNYLNSVLKNEEETPILVTGAVSDNAHDTLSWELRCKLRPVNIPPELLYKQQKVPTDARPVLGRSLVTNHVLPFNINETTGKKRHDLLQVLLRIHISKIMS